MTRRRRSSRRSTRVIEGLAKLCYAGAVVMVILIVVSFIPRRSDGGGDTAGKTESPRTTLRPPALPEPSGDASLRDLAPAAAANEPAIIDDGSFGGPMIIAPHDVLVTERGETPITQVSLRYADAELRGKSVGLILYLPEGGTVAVTDTAGCRQLGNGTGWLLLVGTVDQLNTALSTTVHRAMDGFGNRLEVIFGDPRGTPNARVTHRVVELRPLG